jgi:hypothetical protein
MLLLYVCLQDSLLPSRQAPLSRKNVLLVTSNITWKQGLQVEVAFPVILMGEIASSAAAGSTPGSSQPANTAASPLSFDMGSMRGALLLPQGSQEGQLTMQYLMLTGLAQGAEAVAARSLRDARVWTLCLWNVARWVGGPGGGRRLDVQNVDHMWVWTVNQVCCYRLCLPPPTMPSALGTWRMTWCKFVIESLE